MYLCVDEGFIKWSAYKNASEHAFYTLLMNTPVNAWGTVSPVGIILALYNNYYIAATNYCVYNRNWSLIERLGSCSNHEKRHLFDNV